MKNQAKSLVHVLHNIGKVFEYDREEYETFHNADENDFTVEVPEPISEWVVD